MATRQTVEQELAPGFSILPGGNVMYQVATDYPKQIAEIMANYEARALNPRVNSLGPNPDSAARLQAELIDPFREAFTAAIPQAAATRATQPRTFEIGNRLVQLDPTTGRPVEVYAAPEPAPKPVAPPRYSVPTTVDMLGTPGTVGRYTRDEILNMIPSLDPRLATNAPIAAIASPSWTNAPVATPVADIAPTAVAPVVQPQQSGPKRWKRDASGKLVQVQ